jgi:dolichol-phosphate mannosyltransferase
MPFTFSVIIPTYREEANISRLIESLQNLFQANALAGEIVVVDDDSDDKTAELVLSWVPTHQNVHLVVRKEDPGLSQSVVEGFRVADSSIFVVIDADFSHPIDLIPSMVRGINDGADIVIGSRYMKGGDIEQWPLKRRVVSHAATFLARILFPMVSDPVSGFFAVRKEVVQDAPLAPRGYKILLEILGKGKWRKEKEIPYTFTDREQGQSKLRFKTIMEYVHQITGIFFYSLKNRDSAAWLECERLIRYGCVGATGSILNIVLLYVLTTYAGIYYMISSFFAIEISTLTNFLLNDLWTFKGDREPRLKSPWVRLVSYHVVSAGGMVVNMSVLFVLTEIFGIYYLISNIVGILVAFFWNFLVNRKTTWKIS